MRVTNAMNSNKTALERAFEIAGLGIHESVENIRRQLLREGFNHHQISGPALTRQLLDITRRARITAREDA